MKTGKKRWWLAGLLVVIVVVCLVLALKPDHGPIYQGKTASEWFYGPDASGRTLNRQTSEAFRAMGGDAVPFLVERLRREDSQLTRFYKDHWSSLPAWIRRHLQQPMVSDATQMRAVLMLINIGPPAQPAVPEIIESYKRAFRKDYQLPTDQPLDFAEILTNPPVWFQAAAKKAFTPQKLPAFNNFPKHEQLRLVRCDALLAIGGTNREIVSIYLLAVAARLRGQYGASRQGGIVPAEPAIRNSEDLLLVSLAHPNSDLRAAAANMLRLLISDHPEVIGPMVNACADHAQYVQVQAVDSLAGAKQHLELVVQTLRLALINTNNLNRYAVNSLAQLNDGTDKDVALLAGCLDDTNSMVRAGMAEALGKKGPRARAAVPKLTPLADPDREPDVTVRLQAAQALWTIDLQPGPLVPFLVERLRDPVELIRWSAATALGEMGAGAKPAVPALTNLLATDPSERLRAKAAMTLGQIGTAAQDAIPGLNKALDDEYVNVHAAAADALKRIEAKESAK